MTEQTVTSDQAIAMAQQALNQNRPAEAEVLMRKLTAATPREATLPRYLLGLSLLALQRPAEAIEILQEVLEVEPAAGQVRSAVAKALEDTGDVRAAFEAYHSALIANPSELRARWVGGRLLPRVYQDETEVSLWRHRFSAALHSLTGAPLETPEQAEAALAGVLLMTNFELAYQSEDDRPLQEAWGKFVHAAVAKRFPDLASPCPPPAPVEGRRLKIGLVSEHFYSHTIMLLFGHWALQADTSGVEIHSYMVGGTRDASSEVMAQQSIFRDLRAASIEDAARIIRKDELDCLVFPDLGMGKSSFVLAAFRLAPLQMVSWGHPVTTGLPTIDVFLTSDAMEPEGGEAFYSERLVRLPRLGIYYHPTPVTSGNRAAFGLPDEAIVYLCCQAQQKYLPQHDYLFPAIAAEVPDSRFVFIEHRQFTKVNQAFRQRIEAAFRADSLDPDKHLVFLPWQDWQDFLRLCSVSDVFLDSIGWSGGNTTLEALAQGLPPVTLPGRFMRSRHTMAMLKLMEIDDLIAVDEADYVRIAVRMGANVELRTALRERVLERRDCLYKDIGAVRAFEEMIRREVSAIARAE
ncbi:O-linked N-acetylglucosamine transferase, SPINDLY family protein [Nisaea nitritireducens]|uniref:O-linked N-acetylglucosamine transferase, SPINDLY family protein n=1 Tax=Nisaea nitritireducens TaxID=568392 RepID=UPI001867B1BD|nr:hypothetical protein [Nisaea nitritireducens]